MRNIFNSISLQRPKSNRFDLSHDVKMSFGMGTVVPFLNVDCVPGDYFEITPQIMLRFQPLIAPVMHRVHVTQHFFFVPNRLVWSNWEEWITGNLETVPPYFIISDGIGDVEKNSIGDYFGLPIGVAPEASSSVKVSAFPFAAYGLIWNEYYRDQNLQTAIEWQELVDGDNAILGAIVRDERPLPRGWMHDYFTSCLPFAQKGDAVTLPLTNEDAIPVTHSLTGQAQDHVFEAGTAASLPAGPLLVDGSGGLIGGPLGTDDGYIIPANLEVNVNDEAVDINTLRRAFRLQEWLEKNARAGTRYIENIFAHFAERVQDYRLQRPEYLGGSRSNMSISEVLTTAQTQVLEQVYPVGNMGGHGIALGGGNTIKYKCREHGWIIGVINVQPVTAYQQGIHRSLSRESRLDYYWPTFAHIGEQEVLNKELFIDGLSSGTSDSELEGAFGYLPRYSEYRYMNSRVAGDFRDNLAFWHMGRIFEDQPQLNEDFIAADPTNRIFAVENDGENVILGHIYNQISAVRKMPKYGTPNF